MRTVRTSIRKLQHQRQGRARQEQQDARLRVAYRLSSELAFELFEVLLIVTGTVRLDFTTADGAGVVFQEPRHEAVLVEQVPTWHA